MYTNFIIIYYKILILFNYFGENSIYCMLLNLFSLLDQPDLNNNFFFKIKLTIIANYYCFQNYLNLFINKKL